MQRKDALLIAGVDEVGRSPLAGPIIVGAVLFGRRPPILRGLKDSKATKKKGGKRAIEYSFRLITETAISWAVAQASVKIIESVGVHYATLCAMQKAISQLKFTPGYIFVDGKYIIPGLPESVQLAQPKLDENSWIVAAASIVAKHMRDTLMEDMHNCCPELRPYNFAQNAGYRTPEHLEAISNYGVSKLHRRTFRDVQREGERFLAKGVDI